MPRYEPTGCTITGYTDGIVELQHWEARRTEIVSLVRQVYGRRAGILRMEKIAERTAVVARLHLTDAPVATIIAKFTPRPIAPPWSPETVDFAEEMLAQRFLATLPMARKIKPDLLGLAPGGIFLLEDLGEKSQPARRPVNDLMALLSETFATLHTAGRGCFAAYCQARADAGLGGPEDDLRRNGKAAYRALFARGCAFIQATDRWSRGDEITRELEGIDQAISAPGPLLTFIHDDLSNARQTFELDDSIYLLDFEYAKYSHALLDFAKPLVGKIEFNLRTGQYAWTGPLFPLEMVEHYRDICEAQFNFHIDDKVWSAGVDAMLGYGAVTLLGRLCTLEPDTPLKGTPERNIRVILHYLGELLAKTGGLPALQSFIDRYAVDQ